MARRRQTGPATPMTTAAPPPFPAPAEQLLNSAEERRQLRRDGHRGDGVVENEVNPAADRSTDTNLGPGMPPGVQRCEHQLCHADLVAVVDPRSRRRVDARGEVGAEGGRDARVGLHRRRHGPCLRPRHDGWVDAGNARDNRLGQAGVLPHPTQIVGEGTAQRSRVSIGLELQARAGHDRSQAGDALPGLTSRRSPPIEPPPGPSCQLPRDAPVVRRVMHRSCVACIKTTPP